MSGIEYSGRSYSTTSRETWVNVLVCTLSARDPFGSFTECRENAVFHAMTHGIAVQTLNVRSSAVAQARNLCVEQWRRRDWDGKPPEFLLFLDDDMLFPDEIITRLVGAAKHHGADVLGVLATGKSPPFPVCVLEKHTRSPVAARDALRYHEARDVVEVAAVGMACTLIQTGIFAEMKMPYFSFYHHLDECADLVDAVRRDLESGGRGDPRVLSDAVERMRRHLVGEDYSFCLKAAARGARVLCDFGVETPFHGSALPGIGHLAPHPFSLRDALTYPTPPPTGGPPRAAEPAPGTANG